MAETPGRNTGEASRCPPKRETLVAEAADNSRSNRRRGDHGLTGKHDARMAETSCRKVDGSPAPVFPETESSGG